MLPWLGVAALAVGGRTTLLLSVLYIASFLSYPVLMGVAFFYRRTKPHLVALPALSFVAVFVTGIIEDPVKGLPLLP